jgi:hypothetical protein
LKSSGKQCAGQHHRRQHAPGPSGQRVDQDQEGRPKNRVGEGDAGELGAARAADGARAMNYLR